MQRPSFSRLFALLVLAGFTLAGCSSEDKTTPDQQAQSAAPETSAEAAEMAEALSSDSAVEVGDVLVFNNLQALTAWLETENWWGEVNRGEQLSVPHLIITAIQPSWREASRSLRVHDKKEVFYRLMLPLVLHANSMVLDFRAGLQQAQQEFASDGEISTDSLALIQRLAILLPDTLTPGSDPLTVSSPELPAIIDDLLYRVDVVPAGLALGQAAYESGYGTSRFALEGNSLFGQWTYKGDGIVPEQQRKHLGNPQIKSFDWPFDSVRGYFINLMSHPAYEDFRQLRAQQRAAGTPFDSLVLADGLVKYSERGQEYVDSLKGMIRANKLDVADDAAFRDEPVRFIITENDPEAADNLRGKIDAMRDNGELDEIVARMRLD